MPERPFVPTSEQRAATEAEAPKFTIRAAAGSGKTSVLVARYMREVLELGRRPDQILTITFTRKAAAEMKERIVRALRESRRFEEAQIAETGPIQTIHSLCVRILRENALEAGVDHGFEVLDGSATTVDAAVRRTLASPMDEWPEAQALVQKLAGQQAYGAPTTLHSKLSDAIRRPLESLRSSTFSIIELSRLYADPDEVLAFWRRELLTTVPEEVAEAAGNAPEDKLTEELTKAFKALKKGKPTWLKSTDGRAARKAAEQTCGLMQLVLATWETLEAEMLRTQHFDFTLLESLAVRLLDQRPEVRERIGRQFAAVLVDEAQDVNPVQHRLVASLHIASEMLVGDPQQSIYGFRHADRELFVRRTEELPCMRLTRNHRSQPGVLRFVDALFGGIWPDDYDPMMPDIVASDDDPFGERLEGGFEGVEFWSQKTKDKAQTAAWIKQLIEEGESPRSIAVLTRSNGFAQEIAEKLSRMGVATRMVGGSERFYARLEVRDLANLLEAISDPYDDFSLLALLRSPFVDLSLDAIVLLAKRKPVVEALADFESPIESDAGKVEAFRVWFDPLKRHADRLPAWEALSCALRDSAYLAQLANKPNAVQAIANVRKLLALAAGEPEMDPLNFAERIRQIRELRHREGDAPAVDDDADAVTLMTIHKAKGLEFDVVVLPETHKRLEPSLSDILVNGPRGLVSTKLEKEPSLFHLWMASRWKEREREEELRLLYVAMTRAKRRFCVVVDPQGNAGKIAGLVASRMGFEHEPPPGIRVRETPSDV